MEKKGVIMKKTLVEEEINSITLKKGAKGDYTWEIKVYGDDITRIVGKIDSTNEEMKDLFGGKKSDKP